MAGFFNCGFARVAARNSVYHENGKVIYDKVTRLQRFLGTFSESKDAFAVSQNTFNKRLPVLLKNFKEWRGESKSKYLDHFSSSAWKSLLGLKRGLHSISNCRERQVNHLLFQTQFPLKSNRLKGTADPTSFPRSFVFPQEGVVEERPWFGLVTCLADKIIFMGGVPILQKIVASSICHIQNETRAIAMFFTSLHSSISCSSHWNVNLKPKQVKCLEAVYSGRDVVAVLPTG